MDTQLGTTETIMQGNASEIKSDLFIFFGCCCLFSCPGVGGWAVGVEERGRSGGGGVRGSNINSISCLLCVAANLV